MIYSCPTCCLNSYTLRCLQQQAKVQREPHVLLLAWRLELINIQYNAYLYCCTTQFSGSQVICGSTTYQLYLYCSTRNRVVSTMRWPGDYSCRANAVLSNQAVPNSLFGHSPLHMVSWDANQVWSFMMRSVFSATLTVPC